MSIQKKTRNSKALESDITFDEVEGNERVHTVILLVLLFILIGFSAFALGRLSATKLRDQRGVVVETIAPTLSSTDAAEREGEGTRVPKQNGTPTKAPFLVGSKNSTKYHFPWCSGALRIKPENLITFSSYEEARAAGYTPAGNCDGLQ